MASVWNLVALSALKIRRIKAVLLHPSDKAYCSCPNGNRDRLTAIRPQTDFSIHKNRARCVSSNSIPFGLLPKALLLQRAGIFLRSRKILSHTCRRRETVAFVVIPLKSTEMKKEKNKTGGKPPKPDKATHCIMVRFNSEEFARFLTLYEQSGVYAKAVFIKSRVFGAEFRVLKIDKTLVDYYTKLSALHAQYRAIGVNYNQTVRELKSHYSEKKAMALLFRLEKQTIELIELSRRIIALTNEFQQQWLPKLT